MEWLPVETAPTDRTEILIYSQGNGVAKAAYWGENKWEVQTYTTCCCDYYNDVTHWMPLPEPPKEST